MCFHPSISTFMCADMCSPSHICAFKYTCLCFQSCTFALLLPAVLLSLYLRFYVLLCAFMLSLMVGHFADSSEWSNSHSLIGLLAHTQVHILYKETRWWSHGNQWFSVPWLDFFFTIYVSRGCGRNTNLWYIQNELKPLWLKWKTVNLLSRCQ